MPLKGFETVKPDAEEFYAIRKSEFYFRHEEFEEVEIRVNNADSEAAARKLARQFVEWLQGTGKPRQ
jgi:hypothetical protein